MMYQFAWAGLKVESPVELPDLLPLSKEAATEDTVRIELGRVPHAFAESSGAEGGRLGMREQVGPGLYAFTRPGIARYLVLDGRRVIMEPEAGVPLAACIAFLLGRPFAAIAYQRGWLSLHGSSILREGGAVVFLAAAGTGKSTLLAALEADGSVPLSDDAAIIRPGDDMLRIWPTSGRFRLRADSAAHLLAPGRTSAPVRPGLDKVAIAFEAPKSAPVPLGALYVLERGAAEMSVKRVGTLQAIDLLIGQINRPRLAHAILGRAALFAGLTRIVSHVPVLRLAIADDLARIGEAVCMLRDSPPP